MEVIRAVRKGIHRIVFEYQRRNDVQTLKDGRRGLIFLLNQQNTADGLAPANQRIHLDLLWNAVPRPINALNLERPVGNTTFFRALGEWDSDPEKFVEWGLADLEDYFASQADYLGQPWEPIQTQPTQPANP